MPDAYDTVLIRELDIRYASLRLAQPEQVASVLRSVRQHGVLHPLVVNSLPDGRLVLLDGFKRRQVLEELSVPEAPVRVLRLQEAAAQAAMVTCNQPHRGLCELEEAWVVRSLVRKVGLQQVDVAGLLDRHKSWVCRRLALAERLAETVQDDMRLGLVSATVAREVARLPRGNQERTAQVVRDHGLTSRQSAALVERCLACDDPDGLEELLADPLRFLSMEPDDDVPTPADPRLSTKGEQVRQWLLRFDRAAAGLCQVLHRYAPGGLRDSDRSVLSEMAAPVDGRARDALGLLGLLHGGPADEVTDA